MEPGFQDNPAFWTVQPTDRPLTIVHTEASVGWGGQEIRILQEARWLRAHGHRVLVIAPGQSELLRRSREDGFETNTLRFEKRTQWIDCLRLVRLFRRMKPDVVGTHSSVDSWAGLLAARMARVPVTLRYRHVSAPVHAHFMNRLLYGRCCDHVLTTAECIRKELIANLSVPESKVTTVPTGIEPPTFTKSREESRRELCRKLELNEDARFIGCVAVLRNWKGQEYLMSAFDAISREFPRHRLLLVGEGPGRARLEKHRQGLDARERILLAGHQNDPWLFFRGMDAAILPSYKDEGIPQSLLQAMFAECPALGARTGGIPEIVIDHETGLLFPPKTIPELAAAITSALRDAQETEARVQKALALVRSRHTLDQMGTAVLSIIEKARRRK
jgi:glycosyltransferase involved in cell wall biosynthesis